MAEAQHDAKEQLPAQAFDAKKAMNTKGFPEFLGMHPDAKTFDSTDFAALKERFEIFTVKETVKREVKSIFIKNIQQEMGFRLSPEDLAAADAHFDTLAIESPEEIHALRERIQEFRELPKDINELESQLAALGGGAELPARLDQLKAERASLDKAKGAVGFLGKTKMWTKVLGSAIGVASSFIVSPISGKAEGLLHDMIDITGGTIDKISAARRLEKEHKAKGEKLDRKKFNGISNRVDEQMKTVTETIAAIQTRNQVRAIALEMYSNARAEIMGSISGIAEIAEAVQARAQEHMEELAGRNSLRAFEEMQRRYADWVNISESPNGGINVVEGQDIEATRNSINANIENKAGEEIINAVFNCKLGANSLNKLEQSLKGYIDRERIGSREGDEVRTFVREALEEAVDGLPDDTDGNAKRMLVSHILITLNNS